MKRKTKTKARTCWRPISRVVFWGDGMPKGEFFFVRFTGPKSDWVFLYRAAIGGKPIWDCNRAYFDAHFERVS